MLSACYIAVLMQVFTLNMNLFTGIGRVVLFYGHKNGILCFLELLSSVFMLS